MDILAQIVRLLTPAQRATIRSGDSADAQEKALVRAILANPEAFQAYADYSWAKLGEER